MISFFAFSQFHLSVEELNVVDSFRPFKLVSKKLLKKLFGLFCALIYVKLIFRAHRRLSNSRKETAENTPPKRTTFNGGNLDINAARRALTLQLLFTNIHCQPYLDHGS